MSDYTHNLSIIWQTDIGLQAVDNRAPSDYLRTLARNQSEGKISMLEVEDLIQNRYLKYEY